MMTSTSTSLGGQGTLIASWRALARQSTGAGIVSTPAAVAAVFPAWAPLNNAILLAEPSSQTASAAAADLEHVYGRAGVASWAMWIPAATASLLEPDRMTMVDGMRRDTTTLVMELALAHALPSTDGVVGTSVDAASRASDDPIPASALPPPAEADGLQGWVIVREGLAVTGAWTLVEGTDCGIYTVGTALAWRRRGLARALMQHVLGDAYRRGARTATLQSTPMGEPLYTSLGFESIGRYEEWVPAPRS
jgi:GNAT superfamily N-acetyltransferase